MTISFKRNCPKWKEIDLAFDLADFLTFRLTGKNARSVCPFVCKWGWIAGNCIEGKVQGDWEEELVQSAGLSELRYLARGEVLPTGVLIGTILPDLASDLNLNSNVAIGSGLIDAHAGALGVLNSQVIFIVIDPQSIRISESDFGLQKMKINLAKRRRK